DSIKTESGYDSVFVLNSAGTVVSKWSGTYRAVWSAEVSGNVAKVQLKSDASVTGYGFLSSKYSYYTTTLDRQATDMMAGRIPDAGGELLCQNAPNPAMVRTRISYTLPGERAVSLKVYNLNGQLVRILVSGAQPAGRHAVEWDTRDAGGNSVAAGVYLYRLVAGDLSATKKLTVMR
ncbi:MAG TPA: FlgD immunoglobulin-like domain containing protein, partial [Candidatus Edwardsbacteria bacterium]|nr:FlgD immunoglobulin-like domain containing protein [Candidatus Edwardsbacteria bacterium]